MKESSKIIDKYYEILDQACTIVLNFCLLPREESKDNLCRKVYNYKEGYLLYEEVCYKNKPMFTVSAEMHSDSKIRIKKSPTRYLTKLIKERIE